MTVQALPTTDVLGVQVSALHLDDLLGDIDHALATRSRLRLTFANPNYVMAARRDSKLRYRINSFDHVLTDGWGVMLAARLLGGRIPVRLANDDLVQPLFRLLAQKGARMFLLGSAPGVAKTAARRLTHRFHGLRVAGTMHGYPSAAQATPGHFPRAAFEQMAEAVDATRPDFLVVGLATPIQQQFVIDYLEEVDVPVVMTGGAWIDHLAERIDYYPALVNKLRLCWAYRWAREPRRLTRRYTVELAAFGHQVLKQRRSQQRDR